MNNSSENSQTFDRLNSNIEDAANSVFNLESIVLLIVLLLASFALGRIASLLIRRINLFIGRQADKSNHLPTVERYRRAETVLVISSALIRALLVALALYLWWVLTHPGQQPTAFLGAGAFFAIIAGGVLAPVLRDLANGSMMMTEHWFGVGDHVRVEPFVDLQGVVERVTLRSTRIRGLNGEVIWVNNQNIQGVRVATKGIRTIAIELFVSDPEQGQKLIEQTDLRLPTGSLMVVKPLNVITVTQVGREMWHITAVAQTAPGREWLLEKYAIEIIQELDGKSKSPILKSEPIARFADSEAEAKFARAVTNARKISIRPTITAQLQEAARRERAEIIEKRKQRQTDKTDLK